LFDYAPVFVASAQNPLAEKAFIEAEDFRDQTLITYPVERSRLDLFSQLLIPAKVEPASIRQVELTAVILLYWSLQIGGFLYCQIGSCAR
jgi:LysR family transcriptional regulator for metE and metH